MATATRKLEGSLKTKSWFVRNEQGETFGPVDFETLKAWASDGRLAPTNEVSENGTDWVFATSQGGLAMDWVAEVTPGTFYGPIHKVAMEELVKDGSIAARSPFFMRYALSARPASAADDQKTEQVRKQLTAQVENAQQQAAARAAELEQMRLQASAQTEQSKKQAALAAAELEKMRQRAVESEAQANAARQKASAQVEQAKQQAASATAESEKAAARAEEAKRQTALAASELEQTKQRTVLAAAELEKARQQMAAQAEQARTAQQRLSTKLDEQVRQLAQARQELSAAASRLTELKAENETHAAAWTAKERASDAERQALKVAADQAQAEIATHRERVRNLESALSEAGRAVQEGHAVETQVQSLRSELDTLRPALAAERQTAQQAQARCVALAESLEEAKLSRSGDTRQVVELRSALAQARQQVEGLRAVFRQAESVLGALPGPAVAVETLEAEPLGRETRPPVRPKPFDRPVLEAEVLSPERPKPAAADKPPVANPANQAKPGLSMADLEQQARRELERLGAQGASFFKKKK